jgi:glutamine amidotransferase
MKNHITVIDYGLGNLLSIQQAFEHWGAAVTITDSPELVQNAERLVLPGVGAFEDGMLGLRDRKLIEPIKNYASTQRPLLGICLGMQMLLDRSEEFGVHEGLKLIPGTVTAIPSTRADGVPHKVPHIGWNELTSSASKGNWTGTILNGIPPGSCVYFVHSFTAVPLDPGHRLADCYYNGRLISAAISSGNVWGCQFHPEKSGSVGLRILRNFLTLN